MTVALHAQGRSPAEFSVYNVMLPRTYYPAWQGNLHERRCRAIANQLQGGGMDVDFDQVSTPGKNPSMKGDRIWTTPDKFCFSCIEKKAGTQCCHVDVCACHWPAHCGWHSTFANVMAAARGTQVLPLLCAV